MQQVIQTSESFTATTPVINPVKYHLNQKNKNITTDRLNLSQSVTEWFKILTQVKFLQLRPIEALSQCAGPSVRDLVVVCRNRAERGMAQEGATGGGNGVTHTHTQARNVSYQRR